MHPLDNAHAEHTIMIVGDFSPTILLSYESRG
nr:MAG TPA: hypothetical protein [Caudoviricetes sp.]